MAQGYSVSGNITNGANSNVSLSAAAPSLVQSATAANGTGAIQSTTTFNSIATAGNTILVFIRYGGATVSSVTDSLNNNYVSVAGPTQWGVSPNSTDRWAQAFVASNIAGGNTISITVTLSGAPTHDTYIAALEYSGVDPVHPVNASAVGTGTNSQNGAPATGNMNTSRANTKIVATSWDSAEAYTSTQSGSEYSTVVPAGINSISGGPGWANLTEEKSAPTAGVWNATTARSNTPVDWAIQAVALNPAGAATTTTADTNGNYSFSNVLDGTYSVRPTSSNSSFSPGYQSVTVRGAAVSQVDFTAVAKAGSISGNISPAGAGSGSTVTLSGAAPTLVQTATGTVSAGNSTVTASFPGASTTRDTILLFLRFGGTTVSSVSDNQGNTYKSAVGPTPWGVSPSSTDRFAQVYIATNLAGGPLSVTANLAGSSTHGIYAVALEYSGVDATNPVNAFATGTGTVGQNGAPVTPSLKTTVANATLVATSWDSNDSYMSTGNGNGYNTVVSAGIPSVSGGSGWGNLTEDSIAATAGTWSASASSSPNVLDWAIQVVALTPGASHTTTADGSGNYSFSAVANGTYTVTPTNSGNTFTPHYRQVTVNGVTVAGVNFVAATGTISGRVTDSLTGNPIQAATITYSGGSQAATTDQNGNYNLTLAPGTYSLAASANGYVKSSQQNVTVASNNNTTANFALVPLGEITGVVTNVAGAAIAGATVSYNGGVTHTSWNGSYTLTKVLPGSHNITASATNYHSITQSATVTPAQTTVLNFTLPVLTGGIKGRVQTTTSKAIVGATLTITGGVVHTVKTTSTDAFGHYSLGTLPVGTYTVTAAKAGFTTQKKSTTVNSGSTSTTNFTLK